MSKFIVEGKKEYDWENERGYERIFVSATQTAQCVICKDETSWVNCTFGAPICSHECQDQLWAGYFERIAQEVEEVRGWEKEGIDPELALDRKIKELAQEEMLLEHIEEGRNIT